MDTVMILFIVAVLVMGLFCILVVCRDIILDSRDRRKQRQLEERMLEQSIAQQQQPQPTAQPTVQPVTEQPTAPVAQSVTEKEEPKTEPTTEPVTEPTTKAETETEAETDESNVAFSAATETLDEKYLELSSEYKNYYDEIVRCANVVDGVKRYKNANYEEYKVGKNRIVRLKIRRGSVICELTIPNLQLKNYLSDNKVAVKQSSTVIKVNSESTLAAVKDSIAIAISAIEEEKAYKKEQAKIRRAERRKQEKDDTQA